MYSCVVVFLKTKIIKFVVGVVGDVVEEVVFNNFYGHCCYFNVLNFFIVVK